MNCMIDTQKMMNTDETKEHNPPLSILQRLDRLENLLLFLEKKAGNGVDVLKEEEECKSLSYAFEEVHHKGTLLERVALLENRLMQLSMDLETGNTSRSSSSTSMVAEKLGQGSGMVESNTTHQEKQDPPLITQNSIFCGGLFIKLSIMHAAGHIEGESKQWVIIGNGSSG